MNDHHFYASNSYGWATASTRKEAIEKSIEMAGRHNVKDVIKRAHKEGRLGFYVWSCKVNLPKEAHYEIRNYKPHDVDYEATKEHWVTHCTMKDLAYSNSDIDE